MLTFCAQNVCYVVEHRRCERVCKQGEAGVKRPECIFCAQSVFYDVEHISALTHK